jgi:hypothetical protein
MKRINHLSLIIIFASILLSLFACSLEKRVHSKGYHLKISANKTASSAAKYAEDDKVTKRAVSDSKQNIRTINPVSIDQVGAVLSIQNNPDSLECDIIVFRDGEEKECIVKEITDTEIKYVRCTNPTSLAYYTNKSRVFMIKFADGTKEVFKEDKSEEAQPEPAISAEQKVEKTPGSSPQEPQSGNYDTASIFSFVFGVASFFILGIPFGIAAVVLGAIGLTNISKNPSRRGSTFAVLGLIIGVVAIVLVLLYLQTI